MGSEWSWLWASSWVRLWALTLLDHFAHKVADGVHCDGYASGDKHLPDEVVARALFAELCDAVAEGQKLCVAGLTDWRECTDGFREPRRLRGNVGIRFHTIMVSSWSPR